MMAVDLMARKGRRLIWAGLLAGFFLAVPLARATSPSVADYLPLGEAGVPAGSIITGGGEGFVRARRPYDPKMAGVVSRPGAISFEVDGKKGDRWRPVISSGTAMALVSAANGPIAKGDPITASSRPGVGMKADRSGYVLGTALASFSGQEGEVGLIPAAINIRYLYRRPPGWRGTLSSLFRFSWLAAYQDPALFFRYLTAALAMVTALVLSFWHFSRIGGKGVEALGRNPLAARTIQWGIALNILLGIAMTLAGLGVAWLVLRL